MREFRFEVLAKDKKTKARVGEIATPHGVIKTPAFVPVGTQASVKSLTPDEMREVGVQLFFVNTYHMYLRPGIDVIGKLGRLHTFMGWDGPIITDSGGFQAFSLGRNKLFARGDENFLDPLLVSFSSHQTAGTPRDTLNSYGRDELGKRSAKILSPPRIENLVRFLEEGVEFRSHWDGSKHLFTPENSMERQWTLGSDIHIAFDDCTPYPVTHAEAKTSMERTHRWAKRSVAANEKCRMLNAKLGKPFQALYGSIQGSVYEDLRKESATFISSLNFDGIAIGGMAVGESKKEMVDVLDWVMPILPPEKPRHLLGVGEIDDIFALVERGVDTFDCVQPTRLGRMGRLYVNTTNTTNSTNTINKKWELEITKKIYAEDIRPIDPGCRCYTCIHFSRAYIHHLFRVKELLAYRLATIHNLWFIHRLVDEIRQAIGEGRLLELKKKWIYN